MLGRATSKTYGTVSAAKRSEMSGLEFVQGLANGSLPLNTIAQTLGYDVAEAQVGRVVVTATPTPPDHATTANERNARVLVDRVLVRFRIGLCLLRGT